MPVQIRVVIPNAAPSESNGTTEEDTHKENVPRTVHPAIPRENKTPRQAGIRPTSAPVYRAHVQVPVRPHDIAMHVASIYDVENEHDYIMDKALQAYTQHRRSEEDAGHFRIGRGEGGGKGGVGGGGRPQTAKASLSSRQDHQNTNNSTHCHHHHQRHRRRLLSSSSDGNLSSCSSSFSSSRNALLSERKKAGFKLSLCTLKDGTGNEPIPVPHTHSTPGPGFLPLQRPWSALPSGRLDAIREVSLANNVAESVKTARPVHQHRLPNSARPILPHPATAKMDPPVTRSNAYHIRNRTTHTWGSSEDSTLPIDPMTMSCPNARSLEEQMRNARTFHVPRDPNPSPVIVKGRAIVSPSSPQPPKGDRPASASYSYDGGFFLSASNSGKDYFVIHPDWVSEAMTVQKLSLNDRQERISARTVGPASGRRASGRAMVGRRGLEGDEEESGRRLRRSKSAPPTKHRNPVTWSS